MRGVITGIRARLTYANVVATVALVLVLGGGYALAFKGQGSLLRANMEVEFNSGPVKFLALPAIGKLTLQCDNSGRPNIVLHNKSGKTLVARTLKGRLEDAPNPATAVTMLQATVDDGETDAYFTGNGATGSTQRVSVYPSGQSSRPQAEFVLNLTQDCHAAALVLSTEQ